MEPTLIDVSSFVEAPTGRHGFLKVAGERFAFEDGTPIRFWGAQINLWDKTQVDRTVPILRRRGVNMVRLHGLNFLNGRDTLSLLKFSPDALDKLDYTIWKLGQNGIYITLDTDYPNTLPVGPDDGIPELPNGGPAPHAEFINAKVAKLKQKRMRALYTHVNPYTKKRYCDDPTIALIEVLNEDSMFFYSIDAVKGPFREQLERGFHEWLKQRYPDNPPQYKELIRIGSFRESSLKQHPEWAKQGEDQLRYYRKLEDDYFYGSLKFLREIGVKVPITGTNWVGGGFTNRIHIQGQAGMDYIDRHGYWDHPQGEGNLKWRASTAKFHNLPMVRDLAAGYDPQQENNVGNLITRNAWHRALGHPMTISEWNTCYPNRWSLEGTGMMALYGMLQGWAGLLQFAWTSPEWPGVVANRSFDLMGDPPQVLQFPAIAAMWYRGDVRAGPPVAEIVHDANSVFRFEDEKLPAPIAAALIGKVGYAFEPKMRPARVASDIIAKHWNATTRTARSATGELQWDATRGLVTVDTARTQAAIGFVKDAPLAFRSVRMSLTSEFGAIYVTAMDGPQDIEHARRLLITAVGPARNTGTEYQQTDEPAARYDTKFWRITSEGRAPILMDAVTGTIAITRNTPCRMNAWALDANGKRVGERPIRPVGGRVELVLDEKEQAIPYYEVACQ